MVHVPTFASHAVDRIPVGFVIFQSGNQANGGVESATQIVERIRDVDRVVVTQRETATTERWRRAGAEVHVLPAAFEAWSEDRAALRHVPRNNAWMARMVRRRGLRVVHVNDIRGFLNLGVGARAAGARLVLNVRDVKPPGEPYSINWRAAASLSDYVVTLSREMSDDVTERLCARGQVIGEPRIEHVYSAVDLATMRPSGDRAALRRRLDLAPDRVVLAYVAAFNAKKAQLAFLEAGLAPLVERCPGALVCFVGDFRPDRDDYARRCREAVEARGLADHVRFVGYTAEVGDWYRASDIVLLASRHEGLARCMIEGLACGTPVVSFDVCSAREVLEGHRCGVVVPSGDHRALAAAVAALAADPARRARLGEAGARVARELFDPQRCADRYAAIYRAIAEGTRG